MVNLGPEVPSGFGGTQVFYIRWRSPSHRSRTGILRPPPHDQLVAVLAFDSRPAVTLALPLSASATLLGRVIAFYFPRQRGERLARTKTPPEGGQ
jgi:hypothetical protein